MCLYRGGIKLNGFNDGGMLRYGNLRNLSLLAFGKGTVVKSPAEGFLQAKKTRQWRVFSNLCTTLQG
jgi:hypothetical protein